MTATAPSAEGRPLLSVNNIEVIYDHVILVLKGVSLSVPPGGLVALLGANGAGKSTTLKAISTLLRVERGEVTKGSIEFEGQPIHRAEPASLVVDRMGFKQSQASEQAPELTLTVLRNANREALVARVLAIGRDMLPKRRDLLSEAERYLR